jgi:hypothetical protein
MFLLLVNVRNGIGHGEREEEDERNKLKVERDVS